MSLMVWLPLNGDLTNQGLSNITGSQLGTISWPAGKIGKALYAGNGSQVENGISYNSNLVSVLGAEFSAAIWVCPKGNHVHYNGTFLSSGNWNNQCWSFGVNQDNTQVDIFGAGYNHYITCSVPVNTWTHLACSHKNGVTKLYKNGIYVGEASGEANALVSDASNFCIGRETYAGGYFSFNGYLNDVRIYNHALSAKEIKEISKGLVLHYKLTGIGQENLFKNTNFDSRYTSGTTSQHTSLLANDWGGYNSGVTNATTVYHAHLTQHDGQYVYRYVRNSSNSWLGISQYIKDKTTVGTTYTFSCELYRVSGTNYPHGGHYTKASSTASNSFVTNYSFSAFANAPVGQWIRYSAAITVPASSYINDGVYFYIYGMTGGNGEFLMRHPKLEVGNKATPWTPSISDTIYSSLGFNTAAVQDSSGYNYDGTTSSTFTYTSDCVRYNSTADFVSDKKIYTPTLPTSGLANSYTIAWWAKTSAISGKMFWGFSDGNKLNLYGGIYCNTGDGNSNPFVGVSAPSLNVWHHYAMVGNGSTVGLYVDGVLKGNATTYKPITGTRIYLNGWSSTTDYDFNGLMNDFRIYATALSASDIKELYQIPISVDKSGNVFAMEFIEDQKLEFHKNGTVENSYIHENEADDSDTLKTFHFDKTKTLANQIYEI